MAGPFGRNTDAAGETDVSVDHQQLAVGPVVHAAESGPVRLVIAEHFGAAVAQYLQIAAVHLRRAHPVEQHMHRHTGARFLGKGLRNLLADFPGPVDKRFERDGFLRRADCSEHRRKNRVSVHEYFETVATDDGWPEQQAHRAQKLRIVAGVEPLDVVFDLLLAARQVGDHQHHDKRYKGGQQNRQHARIRYGPPRRAAWATSVCQHGLCRAPLADPAHLPHSPHMPRLVHRTSVRKARCAFM